MKHPIRMNIIARLEHNWHNTAPSPPYSSPEHSVNDTWKDMWSNLFSLSDQIGSNSNEIPFSTCRLVSLLSKTDQPCSLNMVKQTPSSHVFHSQKSEKSWQEKTVAINSAWRDHVWPFISAPGHYFLGVPLVLLLFNHFANFPPTKKQELPAANWGIGTCAPLRMPGKFSTLQTRYHNYFAIHLPIWREKLMGGEWRQEEGENKVSPSSGKTQTTL